MAVPEREYPVPDRLKSRRLTKSERLVMRAFRLTGQQWNSIAHRAKQDIEGNPDLVYDLDSGAIYDPRSPDWEYLGTVWELMDEW